MAASHAHPHSRPHSRIRRAAGAFALSTAIAALASGCVGSENNAAEQPPAAQPAQTAPAEPGTTGSATASSAPASSSPSAPASSASAPSTNTGGEQTATALRAIAAAEREVQGGKVFDLEDETENGQRVWSVKVAAPDGRQFNIAVSHDGGTVVGNDEDKTPDDDIRKLRSAKIGVEDAIKTAAERARGEGVLTSLEIDTTKSTTVVWQIGFGGDDGTTVLVDAMSGDVLDVGPDVG